MSHPKCFIQGCKVEGRWSASHGPKKEMACGQHLPKAILEVGGVAECKAPVEEPATKKPTKKQAKKQAKKKEESAAPVAEG